MHYEYAVDPTAIGSDWNNFKYLIEKFGFDKGRLISKFPGKWEKKVIAAAKDAGMPDVRMKSLVEKLSHANKQRIADCSRDYDSEKSWLENAIKLHSARPFRAIISSDNDPSCTAAIAIDECDEEHVLINTPISRDIPRTSEMIAEALLLLSLSSNQIDIIDPYFDINSRTQNFTGPLKGLLDKLHEIGSVNKVIRVHWRSNDRRPTIEHLATTLPSTELPIPEGFVLELLEWKEVEGGEDFHDRYVLGDNGGILIGAGISAAGPQEHAAFTLLDDSHAASLRKRFNPNEEYYQKIGRTIRVADNGQVDLI